MALTVQTVTGPVSTAELGTAFMHEHTFAATPGLYTSYPQLYHRDELLATTIDKLKQAASRGLRTLVDMSPADFHRDVELVREASIASGVNIIHATGVYNRTTLFFSSQPPDRIAELLIGDIMEGMGGTGIRAGILKCATGPEGVTSSNEEHLRAVARAHRATGVPIGTHTDMRSRNGLDQLRVFADEGVDLSRVMIGHSNDTPDVEYLEMIAERGSWIGMDRFGIDMIFPEADRIDLLVTMVEKGYAGRIVLAHDASAMVDFVPDSFRSQPYWNWNTIHDRILPAIRARGVSEQQITQMLVENPRRIFEAQGAY